MTSLPSHRRRPADAIPRRVRIGLIVNPLAGIGGRVGLKGSDGPETARRAIELGARPEASHRATEALCALQAAWPRRAPTPVIVAASRQMGEDAARAARRRWEPAPVDGASPDVGPDLEVVDETVPAHTTAADTRRLAARLAELGVDLVLFAGGDGTARDIQEVLGERLPVLGIPAGVKIQSEVFGTSPAATGQLAAGWLASARRPTVAREVLDLDEDAYRRGEVRPTLFGALAVPRGRGVQDRKAPSPSGEHAALRGIAESAMEEIDRTASWILGPGTTVRAITDRMGVPKTLVGVDVVEWQAGEARVVAADAGEQRLLEFVRRGQVRIFVTPIGGQGFLFGRGNQPISPAVLRGALGRGGAHDARGLTRAIGRTIVVVATPGKLAGLRGQPLLVDTGDPQLDRELAGHISVISGFRDRVVVAVRAA